MVNFDLYDKQQIFNRIADFFIIINLISEKNINIWDFANWFKQMFVERFLRKIGGATSLMKIALNNNSEISKCGKH